MKYALHMSVFFYISEATKLVPVLFCFVLIFLIKSEDYYSLSLFAYSA